MSGECEAAVKEAERVSSLEFRRLRSGKVTVNDVIDAEDLVKDRREKAALAKVEWYQEWFHYLMTSGEDLRAP